MKTILMLAAVTTFFVSCGKDNKKAALTKSGSCTKTSTVGDATSLKHCEQLTSVAEAIYNNAKESCVSEEGETTVWSDSACSADGVIGTCTANTQGTAFTVNFYADYTAESGQQFCTQLEGTWTAK